MGRAEGLVVLREKALKRLRGGLGGGGLYCFLSPCVDLYSLLFLPPPPPGLCSFDVIFHCFGFGVYTMVVWGGRPSGSQGSHIWSYGRVEGSVFTTYGCGRIRLKIKLRTDRLTSGKKLC